MLEPDELWALLQAMLSKALARCQQTSRSTVRLTIDIDPVTLM
jgi:primosomal protein N'